MKMAGFTEYSQDVLQAEIGLWCHCLLGLPGNTKQPQRAENLPWWPRLENMGMEGLPAPPPFLFFH